MQTKEKIYFKTFGCRTNIYDTELLKGYVKDYELTNDEGEADIVVVNSCTVTNGADSGVRAYVKALQGLRVARRRVRARICLTKGLFLGF